MISLDLMKSSEVRKAGDRSNCRESHSVQDKADFTDRAGDIWIQIILGETGTH